MKKVLTVLSLGILFVSCQKDYNCACTDPWGEPIVVTITKVQKNNAKKECEELDDPGIFGGSPGYYNCQLE